ncbi:class IIb bacteriocin, lactobin A/cerein 7B family [Flavobacterium sp. F52]|uniref:class IIb bacteriocin, lactobin A/cerein 7B family n=1 Tax=Flavobacterium sp. F52 TaxID=1202532 RepID=UPI0003176D77|nr:class IIb bacteriocin, lactobin A/cerein 7B family [Flavobacterium sp. F52]
METRDYAVIELTQDEIQEVEGGWLPAVLGGIAIAASIYGAGRACGEALYYATH